MNLLNIFYVLIFTCIMFSSGNCMGKYIDKIEINEYKLLVNIIIIYSFRYLMYFNTCHVNCFIPFLMLIYGLLTQQYKLKKELKEKYWLPKIFETRETFGFFPLNLVYILLKSFIFTLANFFKKSAFLKKYRYSFDILLAIETIAELIILYIIYNNYMITNVNPADTGDFNIPSFSPSGPYCPPCPPCQ
jgi:hypothetical protein